MLDQDWPAQPFIQRNRIYCADVMEFLQSLPDNSINCVVTSPPYFGLRDYGTPGQIGLEPTPQAFVATMVAVFREVRRVLRRDGVCWLNLGDSYFNSTFIRDSSSGAFLNKGDKGYGEYYAANGGGVSGGKRRSTKNPTLKEKDLIGIPWRVALALQDDGWYLRSDVIWHKPNPMPESVTDRPTKAHEYVFLLTKAPTYWYDAGAILEPHDTPLHSPGNKSKLFDNGRANSWDSDRMDKTWGNPEGRNKRSVWTVPTEANGFAHFATFPKKLIETMILAGCPDKTCAVCGAPWKRVVKSNGHKNKREVAHAPNSNPTKVDSTDWQPTRDYTGDWQPTCACKAHTVPGVVLDPFGGSGTTGLVARKWKRNFLMCDLNPEYVKIAEQRLSVSYQTPLFEMELVS